MALSFGLASLVNSAIDTAATTTPAIHHTLLLEDEGEPELAPSCLATIGAAARDEYDAGMGSFTGSSSAIDKPWYADSKERSHIPQ